MEKFNYEVEDGKLKLGLDSNKDGVNSINLELSLNEAIGEALAKGAEVEGAKSVSVAFTGTTLVVEVDSDKDGEKLMKLEINLAEAIDETGVLK